MPQMIWNLLQSVSYIQNEVMTDLNITESLPKKAGVRLIKKASLRIDMTPMVDLGFLLIAFFIFTTEISKPAATNLYMPHKGGPTDIPDSKSLTILLSNNDKVFYYYGTEAKAIKNKQIYQASFNELDGLGNIIRQKQIELEKRKIDRKELTVLIKPGKQSSYKSVVAALDEMLINKVSRYSIINQENEEEDFLNSIK
jgi:biopolymer transport protein ExbD